jgi:hypothetical protein
MLSFNLIGSTLLRIKKRIKCFAPGGAPLYKGYIDDDGFRVGTPLLAPWLAESRHPVERINEVTQTEENMLSF